MKKLILISILLSSFLLCGATYYKEISSPTKPPFFNQTTKDFDPNDLSIPHANDLGYSVQDVSYYMSDGSFFVRRGTGEVFYMYIYVPVSE